MIRQDTETGWILIGHQDHARLAGEFADKWGNERFRRPDPFHSISVAVSRHDDSWVERDARPLVTPEGYPSAFSRELVGTYDAFEEIDLEGYSGVRGAASEAVAADDPYAAILVSMHTVNLLTEQADLSGLSDADRALHGKFVEGQRKRQVEMKEALLEGGQDPATLVDSALQRGFEFLQACDSLSLILCVAYSEALPLRHRHPDTAGELIQIGCMPLGPGHYRVTPWPFGGKGRLRFSIPALEVEGRHFSGQAAFDAACAGGRQTHLEFVLES